MNTQAAVNSYSKVHYNANVESASPHGLITMLYDGAIERIAQAKGALANNNIELKGKKINNAISIVGGLRENLDHDQGIELSHNLDALYLYIQNILTKAHMKNDMACLDEAAVLLSELRAAWKQIG